MDRPNSTTPSHRDSATPIATGGAARYAWLGALLTVFGGVSWFLLIDVAWIRSYAIPNIALVLIGMGLCIVVLKARRSRMTIIASALSAVVGLGFLVSIFVLMRLPKPSTEMAIGQLPPDFTLRNQDGRPVSLGDYRSRGPVLLVFYRGFW